MSEKRAFTGDRGAILLLVALWLAFFWRLFTPVAADQASLKQGDFSGQFVAFGAYQYERLSQGEIPLWNPYNNGGLPFIADTQAAVFYPPRLATIFIADLTGGWSYHALELEMTFHVLLYSLLMYALLRRMTLGHAGSVFGAFVGSVVGAYGGYMSAYPPLQLAIMEAGIWLPPAVLGVLEATRNERLKWRWLALTGWALGLSWMAGHPQTSWFLTYLLMAYMGYRAYSQRYGWRLYIGGVALFGLIAFGVTAVQMLPGLEYLRLTTRADLGFEAKGNGFPLQDVAQFVFPGIVSLWSPLYVGIVGLALAALALWRRIPATLFWGGVALVALGLSFGDNAAVFRVIYNILPGLRFFRGQERAAYLVAHSLAILAGLGAAHLVTWDRLQDFKATQHIRKSLLGLLALTGLAFGRVLIAWLGDSAAYGEFVGKAAFSAIIAGLAYFLIPWLLANPRHAPRLWLLAGLLVFELFSVNMDSDANYDPIPPADQIPFAPPPLTAEVLADEDGVFRVDGYRGLTDNLGSLYQVMDMGGISPLFLEGPYELIKQEMPSARAWELFAVRYVYLDWEQLPVPAEIVATGTDRYGPVNLHRLDDPRPFALLMYDAAVLDSDDFAYALLDDANFDPRQTVILSATPGIDLPDARPDDASAEVTAYEPERFSIRVETSENALLSVAHPDYPGWNVAIDGQKAEILRAYGALAAIEIPAGDHEVVFEYEPITFRIGATLSMFTWAALVILGMMTLVKNSMKFGQS